MTERELDHLLSTTPGDEVTVDASVNPPHGQITKVTYTRAQVAALIAKVAPHMTEPTMSAEDEQRLYELIVKRLTDDFKERGLGAPFTAEIESEIEIQMPVAKAAFADGQARGRAEEWQPMDTAPKDGRQFIVCWSERDSFDCIGWQEYSEILGYGETPALGWMPLPDAAALRARDRT